MKSGNGSHSSVEESVRGSPVTSSQDCENVRVKLKVGLDEEQTSVVSSIEFDSKLSTTESIGGGNAQATSQSEKSKGRLAFRYRRSLMTNLAWSLFVYVPSLASLIWSSTVITSRYGMKMDKYKKTNFILFGITQILMLSFVAINWYNLKRPEYRCRLPWFLVHLSVGLILFPLSNFLFAHRVFSSLGHPPNAINALVSTFKVICSNVLYTALILRFRVMYLVYCRGIYEPRYPLMLVRMALLIVILTVIPIVLNETVLWCAEHEVAIKGIRTLQLLLLLEFAFYTWKLRGAAQQFVDYQPAVRIWCSSAILYVCAILLPELDEVGFGGVWFEIVISYWIPILMWVEFFGFVVVKDIFIYFNWHGMDNVETVSRAYNLLDPRGELDIILTDGQLYSYLLDISERRYCSENCKFIRDINLLGDFSDKHVAVTKLGTILALLNTYIYVGAPTPVNLPSDLIAGLRNIKISANSSCADWNTLYHLVLEARAYIRQLLGESDVLSKFERDPRVVRSIIERNIAEKMGLSMARRKSMLDDSIAGVRTTNL